MKKNHQPSLRIALDGNEANVSQRVGSNAYAFELMRALERITRKREAIEWTVLLSAPAQKDLPKERSGWRYQVVKPAPLWTQLALPIHLFQQRKNYDVFFTPGHYGPRVSPVPYVSSVMDLGFLAFPKQFKKKDFLQLKVWTQYSVKNARKVIAISEFTKQDVVKQYRKAKSDVVVAYPSLTLGDTELVPAAKSEKILQKLNITGPYFLYLGTLQPRKNLVRVIEAFEKMVAELQSTPRKSKQFLQFQSPDELQLVIAGKVGWLADELLAKVRRSPCHGQILLSGYVNEEEKQVLYRHATASVLVGLYEGFGIPVLEAMALGTIPIVANSSSLPEVVADAGIQVAPTKVTEIHDAMKKVLFLPAKERAQWLKKGRLQLQHFSWEKSAGIVLKTLQEVAVPKKVK